jgi:LacI family transcriptional regulator
MASRFEVALIIDAGSPYDRRIIRGVASYVERQRRDWSLYVEEDLTGRLPDLRAWGGDGIVANFDDRRVASAVTQLGIPVVGVGGGYGHYDERSKIPYVRTDNRAIAQVAAEHLMGLGLRQFAVCGYPPSRTNGWAKERGEEFQRVVSDAGFKCHTYVGRYSPVKHWRRSQTALQHWLEGLPKPIGMMAADDSRARHVLQASRIAGLQLPEDIALVGVDNDDVMCEITQPTLTSIEQGSVRVGYEAAMLLDRLMTGKSTRGLGTTVPPEGLVARRSTDVLAVNDDAVVEALHYIRKHAFEPIHVRDVLKAVRTSRSNLETKFRQHLGRSIYSEIRRLRVDEAKRLLTSTNTPIKEIARRVGVSSVQYFTVMIHHVTGMTPGEIRKSSLN